MPTDGQLLLAFMLDDRPPARPRPRRWILGLERNRGRNGGRYQPAPDPPLLVILARAAIIRRGWTEDERRQRARFAESFRR
jgi:hypothetical protein